MKRFTSALIIALLLLTVISSTAIASWQGYVISATMYGGQTANKVGFAKIWNDADNLYIYFMMRAGAGWCLEEYHVHAGLTLADFPMTSNGNLIPGHFDYKASMGGCVREATVTIPLTPDLENLGILPGEEFFLALHAVVSNRFTGQQETSWTVRCGDLWGQQFPGDPGWEGYVRFTSDAWFLD